MRESAVRGQAIDLGDFERRLRGEATADREYPSPSKRDPLTELARLMQEQEAASYDPYADLLQGHQSENASAPQYHEPYTEHEPDIWQERAWEPETEHVSQRGSQEDQLQEEFYPDYSAVPQDYEHSTFPQAGYEDHSAAYNQDPRSYHQDSSTIGYPDQFEDQYATNQLDWDKRSRSTNLSRRSALMRETFLTLLGGRLRAWHVVSVIGVVAVISIAWGFMHRSRIGSHEIAIIQAPEGPMKVKPNIETDQDAPQTGGATVLDRKETAPVKQVVNNQEQAVDPKVQPQTLKIGNDPVNAPHEAPSLAEPHRVKSVTVRPDGSPASGMNALPPAVVAKPVSNLDIEASQQGGTPKTLARPVTTAQVVKPKVPAPVKPSSPAVNGESVSPKETTEAPTPPVSGGYAVQFGAAGSEAEAKAMVKTVIAKYGADLGGRKPSYKIATVSERTVYRVRVGGVTKDSATTICSKVKESGGSCFVAGN